MSATLAAVLTVLAGLAFGGAVSEAFYFVSRQRVSFALASGAAGLLAAPLLMVAGPIVLIRNSLWGYAIQGRPLVFTVAGVAFGLAWSGVSGWLLLALASLFSG